MGNVNNLRLAVLIDADNAPRDSLRSVMEEIAVYGTPTEGMQAEIDHAMLDEVGCLPSISSSR